MDETCVCGHVYDEHDDGQECTVEFEQPHGSTMDTVKCMCVYFEAADPDDESKAGSK